MTDMTLHRLDDVAIDVTAWDWPFAQTRRDEIDAHFTAEQRRRPALWNGRILMLRDVVLSGRTLCATCFETDFASFMAWRDWGAPDRSVINGFAMGALCGSDGAFLLGVMGAHTSNADRVYFPAGTPDPGDVTDGRLDFGGSVWREVAEETGLGPADLKAESGWAAVCAGPQLALIRRLTAREPAAALRERIRGHLRLQADPELSDIVMVRGPADLDPRMPPFVGFFLRHAWGG